MKQQPILIERRHVDTHPSHRRRIGEMVTRIDGAIDKLKHQVNSMDEPEDKLEGFLTEAIA